MIELTELLRELRAEVDAALAASADGGQRFEVRSIELEVNFAVERSGEAGTKVRFWVAEPDRQPASTECGTQRLRLELTPSVESTLLGLP